MKKAFATLALLTCVFTAVSQDFKKHSFGIGIGGSSFPIVKSYSDFMNNTDGFNVSNAFVTSLSLKYDYAFMPDFRYHWNQATLTPTFRTKMPIMFMTRLTIQQLSHMVQAALRSMYISSIYL